ncbi:MAG: 2'-5' RNA ligase family protein [Treponema sp.]|nr:2'-5' RNA ligase family protein [Treponema sp.]
MANSNLGGKMQDKFLTVFAVFDEATQKKLKSFQDSVLGLGCPGTQTMDIPFHISLGSFKVEDECELKARITSACSHQRAFEIRLQKVGHFSNRVLFIEPEENVPLRRLHDLFDSNFADGFPWHAHATIFCGEEAQVIKAKSRLDEIFTPVNGTITGIQMGEFFPTRMIAAEIFCE